MKLNIVLDVNLIVDKDSKNRDALRFNRGAELFIRKMQALGHSLIFSTDYHISTSDFMRSVAFYALTDIDKASVKSVDSTFDQIYKTGVKGQTIAFALLDEKHNETREEREKMLSDMSSRGVDLHLITPNHFSLNDLSQKLIDINTFETMETLVRQHYEKLVGLAALKQFIIDRNKQPERIGTMHRFFSYAYEFGYTRDQEIKAAEALINFVEHDIPLDKKHIGALLQGQLYPVASPFKPMIDTALRLRQ